jgi:hypothetical protein
MAPFWGIFGQNWAIFSQNIWSHGLSPNLVNAVAHKDKEKQGQPTERWWSFFS